MSESNFVLFRLKNGFCKMGSAAVEVPRVCVDTSDSVPTSHRNWHQRGLLWIYWTGDGCLLGSGNFAIGCDIIDANCAFSTFPNHANKRCHPILHERHNSSLYGR